MAQPWYVVRTAPGSQQPQREYTVHATRGPKGYRLVPSLNPNISAVERALRDNGFTHYMPVERRLVRDRRKHSLWKPRRFAILIGYVFVTDVHDWRLLEETPGVVGIVGIKGEPLAMPDEDMAKLSAMEAKCEELYEQEVERRKLVETKALAARNKLPRSKARDMFPVGATVEVTEGFLRGYTFTVAGLDRDGRLRAIAEELNALGTISLPVSDVRLVA